MKTNTPVIHGQLFSVIATKRGRRPTVEAVTDRADAEEYLRDMAAEPKRYNGCKGRLQPVRLQFI